MMILPFRMLYNIKYFTDDVNTYLKNMNRDITGRGKPDVPEWQSDGGRKKKLTHLYQGRNTKQRFIVYNNEDGQVSPTTD